MRYLGDRSLPINVKLNFGKTSFLQRKLELHAFLFDLCYEFLYLSGETSVESRMMFASRRGESSVSFLH